MAKESKVSRVLNYDHPKRQRTWPLEEDLTQDDGAVEAPSSEDETEPGPGDGAGADDSDRPEDQSD